MSSLVSLVPRRLSASAVRVTDRPAVLKAAFVATSIAAICLSTSGVRWAGSLLVSVSALVLLGLIVLRAASGKAFKGSSRVTGALVFERLTVGIAAAGVSSSISMLTALWLGLWIVALASETLVEPFSRKAVPTTANFAGVSPASSSLVPVALGAVLNMFAAIVGPLGDFWPSLIIVAAVLSAGSIAAVLLNIVIYRQQAKHYKAIAKSVPDRLRTLQPKFLLHWQAPKNTQYQIAMWLPYLEEVGEPFFVLVRTPENLAEARLLTSRPVVLVKDLEDLDPVMVPSLKAALYTNNSTRNVHLIRYMDLTHIQLNHGDSDKAPSYNPAFRMFDRNFVAGQAAIDRYSSRGIATQPDFFEIVSRPQTSDIATATPSNRALKNEPKVPFTVLYAPTWHGFNAQTNYTSLEYGVPIVRGAIEAGATVIFRPHPYSLRSSIHKKYVADIEACLEADGPRHSFGTTVRTAPIAHLFNQSDVLITDVSSVMSDYIASSKPFLVASNLPPEELAAQAPLSEVAYCVFPSKSPNTVSSDVARLLAHSLNADELAPARRAARSYYLGDFTSDERATRFAEVLRKYL